MPRTEVGWLYVDGQEVQLTPDEVLALRAAELPQRAQKRAASKRKRKKNDTAEENNTSRQEESLLRTDRGRRGNDREDQGRKGINQSLRPANKLSALVVEIRKSPMRSGLFKEGKYHDWECKITSEMVQMD